MGDRLRQGNEASDTQTLLSSSDENSLMSENRMTVLKATGGATRPWFLNPRIWAVIIGVAVVIIAVVLVVVLTTLNKNGHNVKQVKLLVDASKSLTTGYDRLGYMLDTYGSRISGSQGLNDSLTWMAETMRSQDGFDVKLEPVLVNHWVRNQESLFLNSPRSRPLPMLGLGGSVGTNNTAITAQVLVVDSYEELDRVQAQVPGKIVLFNGVWDTSYSKSVQFRSRGAIKASQYGAVAVLVRSVTPFSLQSPHTGNTNYDASVPKIPAAAITVEDASYMRRVQDRGGQTITVTLTMGAERLPPAPSFNLIGEIKGSKYPNQYVIMGGHTDSWDVGQGAHDDAGGVFAAWEALRLIKSSGLVPQRTIRVVGWVDEEQGGSGGNQYVIDHANELPNTVIAMESDTGTFNPTQLAFTGTTKGYSGARKFGSYYLEKFLNVEVGSTPYPDADITPLAQRGVPTFSMRNSGNVSPGFKYFEYHHTHADTFDKIDKEDFNKNVAVFAVAAWVASAGEWALK